MSTNLFASVESSLLSQGGAHLVDQLFGAGTFEGTKGGVKTLATAQINALEAAQPGVTPTEAEVVSYLESEAEALAPELNAKIDALLAQEAFSKNAFVAYFEAQAMKALVPAETAAIKSLVPDAVREVFALIPAPYLSIASELAADAAKTGEGTGSPLEPGAGLTSPGSTQGLQAQTGQSLETTTNNPADSAA